MVVNCWPQTPGEGQNVDDFLALLRYALWKSGKLREVSVEIRRPWQVGEFVLSREVASATVSDVARDLFSKVSGFVVTGPADLEPWQPHLSGLLGLLRQCVTLKVPILGT